MYDERDELLACPECNLLQWRDDVPTKETIPDSTYFGDPKRQSTPIRGVSDAVNM